MRAARLLTVALLCLGAAPALADTGTYEILDYQVTLTPHSDGKVAIDYYQKWRVTGGSIPWITVGLANSDFEITESGLAAAGIRPQSEAGWSGVRIELDRDYQPGQQFEISFSVSQNKLFYADETNYRLDFSPGWYDRAPTRSLTIRLESFAKTESVTSDPEPTSRSDTELVWSGMRLGEGERYTIHIAFPKRALPSAIPEGQLRSGEDEPAHPPSGWDLSDPAFYVPLIILLGLVAATILIAWLSWRRGDYSGGGIWYGGTSGGTAGTGRGARGGGGIGREPGGGGGFGGGGFSCVCACACVSCACACACAGGGAAGCTSKHARHRCPQCDPSLRLAT